MSLSVDQDLAGFITHYYKKCYQAGTQGGHFQDQLIIERIRRQNQNLQIYLQKEVDRSTPHIFLGSFLLCSLKKVVADGVRHGNKERAAPVWRRRYIIREGTGVPQQPGSCARTGKCPHISELETKVPRRRHDNYDERVSAERTPVDRRLLLTLPEPPVAANSQQYHHI